MKFIEAEVLHHLIIVMIEGLMIDFLALTFPIETI